MKCMITTNDKKARDTSNCIQRNILTLKIKGGKELQELLGMMIITNCHVNKVVISQIEK